MKFTEWIRGLIGHHETAKISLTNWEREIQGVAIEEFAVHAAINLIAGAVSKCEFRTFLENKEKFGDDYYRWNLQPNKNQNSSQFLQELVSRLFYDNECLVIESGGDMMIAESFSHHEEYALREDVFTQISRGDLMLRRPYPMSEVLYFKLNNRNIRSLLSGLCDKYAALFGEAVDKYEKSGGSKGILKVGAMASGKEGFEEKYETLMNERFKTYFNAKNAVLPLFDGLDYEAENSDQSKKTSNEITDIKSLTDQAFERVAQAFKIPASLLKGDIADIEAITNNFLTFCIDPLCDMLSEEINRKFYGKGVLKGNYLTIDTTCIEHIDVFGKAEKIDKLIACGAYNVDEIRRKLRDTELRTKHSQTYYITKNYSEYSEAKGGEEQ